MGIFIGFIIYILINILTMCFFTHILEVNAFEKISHEYLFYDKEFYGYITVSNIILFMILFFIKENLFEE